MTYYDELRLAMGKLAEHPKTVFIGQAVLYPGTAMYGTLDLVPDDKKIELPVAEEMQLGMAIGMSMCDGTIPVCIYPRINFLLLAMNQLVNHLDKIPFYGNGWKPKVIIRTAIASDKPLDPGVQHLGNYAGGLRTMLSSVDLCVIPKMAKSVEPWYGHAMSTTRSIIMIEHMEMYDVE